MDVIIINFLVYFSSLCGYTTADFSYYTHVYATVKDAQSNLLLWHTIYIGEGKRVFALTS